MALNITNYFKNVLQASRHLKPISTFINQHAKEEPRLLLRMHTCSRNIEKKKEHIVKLTQEPMKLMIHNTGTVREALSNKKLRRGPTTPWGPCKDPCSIGRQKPKKDLCGPPKKNVCDAYFPANRNKARLPAKARNPCGPRKDSCPKAEPCPRKPDPCCPSSAPPKPPCVPEPCQPKKEKCTPCPPAKKGPCGCS